MTDEGTLPGAGGVVLHWRWAEPAGPPRGVVLLVHGYAEHIGRYDAFVAHQAADGLAVAGVDLRGHGRSAGPRGHMADMSEYVSDVRALADAAWDRWPGLPRVLLGHSMGGLVTLAFLLRHPDVLRAAAITCPALRVPPGSGAPPWKRALVRRLASVAPRMGFASALDTTNLSRDPAVGAAYLADPLVHHRATAGFVRALEDAQAAVMRDASAIATPLLVLQGDADRLIDPEASAELVARLTCPHELVRLPGYYHELLNEPPAERAVVWEAIDRWFDRWLAL